MPSQCVSASSSARENAVFVKKNRPTRASSESASNPATNFGASSGAIGLKRNLEPLTLNSTMTQLNTPDDSMAIAARGVPAYSNRANPVLMQNAGSVIPLPSLNGLVFPFFPPTP